MTKLSSIVFCFLFLGASSALACIHAKNGKSVDQYEFKVALAHAKGQQTIVIKPEIRTNGREVGWVFLVPNHPTVMKVGKSNDLKTLSKYYFPADTPKRTKSMKKSAGRSKAVQVSKTVQVGPFSITPIKGGYEGISKWLKANDFGPIPKDHIQKYLEKDWVVLAAKIKISKAQLKSARKKMRAKLIRERRESKASIIYGFEPTPTMSKEELKADLEAKLEEEMQNPKIDIPPLIIKFKSKKIVFPWLFERTNTVAAFEFLIFRGSKLSAKTVADFEKSNEEDFVYFDSFPNDYLTRKRLNRRRMPKRVKRLLRTFGFKPKQKVFVERVQANAASHKDAVEKGIPDISF